MMLSMSIAVPTYAASVIHLICRGGISGKNSLEYTAYSSATGVVSYNFTPYKGKKSDVKRDGSHLGPGECSWATDVLASKYNTLVYYTNGEQVLHDTYIQPSINDDGTVSYTTQTVLDPGLQDDPKQYFLPFINTADNSTDPLKGSILDDTMIFNFYVVIDKYDRLVLQ